MPIQSQPKVVLEGSDERANVRINGSAKGQGSEKHKYPDQGKSGIRKFYKSKGEHPTEEDPTKSSSKSAGA